MIDEASSAGFPPRQLFLRPDQRPAFDDRPAFADVPAWELDHGVFDSVSVLETPSGVAAVVDSPAMGADPNTATFALVLVGLADPGNVGTLLRSAEAAGCDAVFIVEPSADPFSPKAVRASAGALFRIPVTIIGDLAELTSSNLRILGTTSHAMIDGHDTRSVFEVDVSGRIAVLLGNESHGLRSTGVIEEWITIPHAGRAESLNVAMAGTALCLILAHRRRLIISGS